MRILQVMGGLIIAGAILASTMGQAAPSGASVSQRAVTLAAERILDNESLCRDLVDDECIVVINEMLAALER